MVIYRVENTAGIGPYLANDHEFNGKFWDSEELCQAHGGCPRHPVIDTCEIMAKAKCACLSLQLLNKWFDGFMDLLLDHGFNVVKLEVSECFEHDSFQCTFREKDVLSREVLR